MAMATKTQGDEGQESPERWLDLGFYTAVYMFIEGLKKSGRLSEDVADPMLEKHAKRIEDLSGYPAEDFAYLIATKWDEALGDIF